MSLLVCVAPLVAWSAGPQQPSPAVTEPTSSSSGSDEGRRAPGGISVHVSGDTAGENFRALFDSLPHRKEEGAMERDPPLHTYFAHRGYVTARVDIRDTGAHYW